MDKTWSKSLEFGFLHCDSIYIFKNVYINNLIDGYIEIMLLK